MSNLQNQYIPDYVSPPGETLLELIEERGISQNELAKKLKQPEKVINGIIQGIEPITSEIALTLEQVLGTSATFWNNREKNYQDNRIKWMKKFPIKEMAQLNLIDILDDKLQQSNQLLKFFGITSPEQWEEKHEEWSVAFRKSTAFESNYEAISVWLRWGEIEAESINCNPYSATKFKKNLEEIRKLTLEPPQTFQQKLIELCAEAGVAVVFVPQLPKARVSGATRWLTPQKALIQLSLRYKTDDQLWFTFFHEAGHILLHGQDELFLHNKDIDDEKEQQANQFASDFLIPPKQLKRFLANPSSKSKQAITKFGEELGIAPGIVVGRLQYYKHLPYSHCNGLKQTFEWK